MVRRLVVGVIVLVIALLAGLSVYQWPRIATLRSFEKLDDFPLFVMKYQGEYGLTELLEHGASDDEELERFLTKYLLFGQALPFGAKNGYSCSVFTARTPTGEQLLARNWDFMDTPAMVLFTNPPSGYASLSTVHLAFGGFTAAGMADLSLMDRTRLLAAPYIAVDGMNEHGLAVAFLAVPDAVAPFDPSRPTINTTTAIRLMLDRARSVNEAIELLSQYNLFFSMDIPVHYVMADRTGHAAVVEFVEGDVVVTYPQEAWHMVTNFVLHDAGVPPVDHVRFVNDGYDRYNTIREILEAASGTLSVGESMSVLEEVHLAKGGAGSHTLWSVVYEQTAGIMTLALDANYERFFEFSLDAQ